MKRPNVDRARALRCAQTDAERLLWRHLRDRQLLGWKFRRQHEIGVYIADFSCADANLIVELDGGQHVDHALHDEHRTELLQRMGYRVLRFWNDDVLKATDRVLEQIVRVLPDTPPHPGPLPEAERETSRAARNTHLLPLTDEVAS
jgi:very-short-patch-repair endonuclease